MKNLWTDEDRHRLASAIEAGVSIARTAVALKRSMKSVRNQAFKMGKLFPSITERRRELRSKIDAAARRE